MTPTTVPAPVRPWATWLRFAPRPDFGAMRAHRRHPCCIVAKLGLLDRGVELDGLVLELSAGGLLFREASTFVYDRRGASVCVSFDAFDLVGTIVNVHPGGYGVKLMQPLGDEEVERALAMSDGLTAADEDAG